MSCLSLTMKLLLLLILVFTAAQAYQPCSEMFHRLSSADPGSLKAEIEIPLMTADVTEWIIKLDFNNEVQVELADVQLTSYMNKNSSSLNHTKVEHSLRMLDNSTIEFALEYKMEQVETRRLSALISLDLKYQGNFLEVIEVQVNGQSLCSGVELCGLIDDLPMVTDLIYRGNTMTLRQAPWLVALFINNGTHRDYFCSGSLISHNLIVTAAHCMLLKKCLAENIEVHAGVGQLSNFSERSRQISKVKDVVEHYNYKLNPTGIDDSDIAVVLLSKPANFTKYVRPICLNSGLTLDGKSGEVFGWGKKLGIADEARQASLRIVSTENCRASDHKYKGITSDNTFCAALNDAGPCHAGGMYMPMTLPGDRPRWYFAGIASKVMTKDYECDPNKSFVFTRLTSFFPQWFTEIGGIYQSKIKHQVSTAHLEVNLDYQLNKIARMHYKGQKDLEVLIGNNVGRRACVPELDESRQMLEADHWNAIISRDIRVFDDIIYNQYPKYNKVNPNQDLSINVSLISIMYEKAYVLYQDSNYEDSLNVYNDALSHLSTTAAPDPQLKLWILFGKLEVLNALNDLDQSTSVSKVIFEKLAIFPDMTYMKPGLLFNEAEIFSKQGLYEDALEIYEKLITMATQYTESKTDVSNYTALQIYPLLLKQRNNFFNHKTENIRKVMQRKVTVLRQLYRLQTALQVLDDIIKLQNEENLVKSLKDKAEILSDLGQYKESVVVFDQLIKQTENHQVMLDGMLNKAITLVKLGLYQQAIADFKTIVTSSRMAENRVIYHQAQYYRRQTEQCYRHKQEGINTPCDFWKHPPLLGHALKYQSSDFSHIEVELADIDSDVINIAYIQLQYRQLDKASKLPVEKWSLGPKVRWSVRPKVITISQLSPNTKYEIRALLVEKNGRFYDGEDIPTLIKTTLCKPTDLTNISVTARSTTVLILLVYNQVETDEACPINTYNISVNGMTDNFNFINNFEAQVTGLEPNTVYTINVANHPFIAKTGPYHQFYFNLLTTITCVLLFVVGVTLSAMMSVKKVCHNNKLSTESIAMEPVDREIGKKTETKSTSEGDIVISLTQGKYHKNDSPLTKQDKDLLSSNLRVTDVSDTTVTLQWNTPSYSGENIISYELYWNDTCANTDAKERQHRSIPVTDTYTLTYLYPNTLYFVWVAATSERGEGATTRPTLIRTNYAGTQQEEIMSERQRRKLQYERHKTGNIAAVDCQDEDRSRPLLEECEEDSYHLAKSCILRDADVSYIGDSMYSPLHLACARGFCSIAELLLQHGADINIRNDYGFTPIHKVCASGKTELVKILVQHGADINIRHRRESTPLHCACRMGKTEVVKILVQHGADVNATDIVRCTPLHLAAKPRLWLSESDQIAVMNYLLEHGADINAKDERGRTALDIATNRNFQLVVEFLEQKLVT